MFWIDHKLAEKLIEVSFNVDTLLFCIQVEAPDRFTPFKVSMMSSHFMKIAAFKTMGWFCQAVLCHAIFQDLLSNFFFIPKYQPQQNGEAAKRYLLFYFVCFTTRIWLNAENDSIVSMQSFHCWQLGCAQQENCRRWLFRKSVIFFHFLFWI